MTQGEIITDAMMRNGFRKKSHMMRSFNERMGFYAVTRETWRNWTQNKHRCDPRILSQAMRVYEAGDWRYQMAASLMAVAQPVVVAEG